MELKPTFNEKGKFGYQIIQYTISTIKGNVFIIASVDINRKGNFEVLEEGYWSQSTVNRKISQYCKENVNTIKYNHAKHFNIVKSVS